MSEKAIDLMPDHRAQLPRIDHDLGHDFGFTATCAQLLPVFHTIMNAGETIELGMDFNLRTMPLSDAAMTKIDTHVEYYFVPFQLLFQKFADIEYNISEQFSSFFDSVNPNWRVTGYPLLKIEEVQDWFALNKATIYKTGSDCMFRSAFRLFDMLGLNPYVVNQNAGDTAVSGYFFPYQLLAYNCIYNYVYRLDTREKFDAKSFNWDQWFDEAVVYPGMVGDNIDWFEFFSLKTRPVRDDYFTSIKISPIVDVLNLNYQSALPFADSWLSRSSIGSDEVLTNGSEGDSAWSPTGGLRKDPTSYVQTNFGFNEVLRSISGNTIVNGTDINTANIRAIFASEKLWSITGRAKKNYDDQTLAHFGYKVPHDPKHQVSKFGHDRGVVEIGEVISTAASTLAPLGEIAGKGYGTMNSGRHKFTAPCHGVVMMLWSATPRYRYHAGFARYNVVTKRDDLYTPEYDHLGMQPLFNYELYMNTVGGPQTTIAGWQYRYEQWKRRYDKVTLAFDTGFTPATLSSWMMGKTPLGGTNVNAPNSDATAYKFHYYSIDLNQIMLKSYNPAWDSALATTPSLVYENDPLIVNSHIHALLVSTMSKYSLPRLDD